MVQENNLGHAVDNNWNLFSKKKPLLDKKVLIWRISKGKYLVGALKTLTSEEEGPHEMWVSEYSLCHYPDFEDRWLEFPYVMCNKIYN